MKAPLVIDPGQLRSEMQLEAPVRTADGLGGSSEGWSLVATVFGMIEPVAAVQRLAADQTIETTTHRITLRHRAGISSGMRLTKGARRFLIATVRDPDETGRYLMCSTEELT